MDYNVDPSTVKVDRSLEREEIKRALTACAEALQSPWGPKTHTKEVICKFELGEYSAALVSAFYTNMGWEVEYKSVDKDSNADQKWINGWSLKFTRPLPNSMYQEPE